MLLILQLQMLFEDPEVFEVVKGVRDDLCKWLGQPPLCTVLRVNLAVISRDDLIQYLKTYLSKVPHIKITIY